jgi:hypothetical protein
MEWASWALNPGSQKGAWIALCSASKRAASLGERACKIKAAKALARALAKHWFDS